MSPAEAEAKAREIAARVSVHSSPERRVEIIAAALLAAAAEEREACAKVAEAAKNYIETKDGDDGMANVQAEKRLRDALAALEKEGK